MKWFKKQNKAAINPALPKKEALETLKRRWSNIPCAHKSASSPVVTKEWYDKEQLINTKYKNTSILYKETIDGYRIYDGFGGADIILCMGCSNTYGIGLPDHETWPYILWEHLGKKHYTVLNYGFPGASADYITRILSCILKHGKPKAIFCLFPEITRKEYYSNTLCMLQNYCTQYHSYNPEYEHENLTRITDSENSLINFIKNFKFIETLCSLHNVPLIWHTWSDILLNIDSSYLKEILDTNTTLIAENNKLVNINEKYKLTEIFHKARDGGHNGVEYNKILAKSFYDIFKNEHS